ncbi:DUF5694 domain-containing protein [Proteinivorax tanatarense]|uniref:DUF5694 domain-containing protein n=1 Tax=Proteinivorax tanatarense TaxID=1260629 RepID=A0AAU7VLZ8_9FIRM
MLNKNNKPVILILGSYHMNNPNQDLFNVKADDVFSSKRQVQIRECINLLKKFSPTKIALEVPADKQDELNSRFKEYLNNSYKLGRSEGEQLGFRIASELGHKHIYGIDWNEGEGDGRFIEYAKVHQKDIYDKIINHGKAVTKKIDDLLAGGTIKSALVYLNNEKNLALDHRIYLQICKIGHRKEYLGVDWVKGWYERNLKIYTNLTRIVTSDRDRVLIIYGYGHVPLLKQFAIDCGYFDVKSLQDYLD